MFLELSASNYESSGLYYKAEFEDILSKIIMCYRLMVADKVSLLNDENCIRDVLLINYLKNREVRKSLELNLYLFDREVPEDMSSGRTDIKIQTINTFEDNQAYYIIECKRLDNVNTSGKTGLNSKYIQDGVARFIQSSYSSYYRTNGMIGFLVAEIDIDINVGCINDILLGQTEISTLQFLRRYSIQAFDYVYCSTHSCNNEEIVLYHLMFDFSKNIV